MQIRVYKNNGSRRATKAVQYGAFEAQLKLAPVSEENMSILFAHVFVTTPPFGHFSTSPFIILQDEGLKVSVGFDRDT